MSIIDLLLISMVVVGLVALLEATAVIIGLFRDRNKG